MSLVQRITNILSINIGEMVEKCEDPELMLKQSIREMDESIREATQATAEAMANKKLLEKDLAKHQSEVAAWQSRAEQAVDNGDDAAARKALTHRKEHEELVVSLEANIAAANDASETLQRHLKLMKSRHDEAKRSLSTLSARRKAAEVRKKVYSDMDRVAGLASDDDAFEKFDRMKDKVERAEAEADAMAELHAAMNTVSASTVESATEESDLDAELAALKASRSKSN